MASLQRKSSLTIDASWLLIARTISFVFSLALPLFLVRHLDQVEFGVYKQTFLVVNSLVMMVPLGFGMSALYFLPREPEKQKQTVFNILLFNSFAGGLVCLAFAIHPPILGLIFGGPEMIPYARAIGVIILLWTSASAFEFIAVALNEMREAGAIIIVVQLTRTAFVLGAALFFGSVKALVVAATIQGVCQVVAFVVYLEARFRGFWRHFDPVMMRRQLSYALPLGAAGLLYTLQTDLHNYFVSHRFGPALFAVYTIGTTQLPLVYMLQEAATSVLIPRISLLQRSGEKAEIILQMLRAIRKLAAVYLPVYFLLLVAGHEFIRFLFTDRYLNAWPVFVVNLTMLPISVILFDPLYRAYADQRYFLIRVRAVLFAVVIVLLWLGTTYFGLVGAIASVVIVSLAERVITIIRFSRILEASWSDLALAADVGKIALAAAAAALATALVRIQVLASLPAPIGAGRYAQLLYLFSILAVCGSVFAAVYVAGVLLLKIPSPDEKRMALNRLRLFVPPAMRPRLP